MVGIYIGKQAAITTTCSIQICKKKCYIEVICQNGKGKAFALMINDINLGTHSTNIVAFWALFLLLILRVETILQQRYSNIALCIPSAFIV